MSDIQSEIEAPMILNNVSTHSDKDFVFDKSYRVFNADLSKHALITTAFGCIDFTDGIPDHIDIVNVGRPKFILAEKPDCFTYIQYDNKLILMCSELTFRVGEIAVVKGFTESINHMLQAFLILHQKNHKPVLESLKKKYNAYEIPGMGQEWDKNYTEAQSYISEGSIDMFAEELANRNVAGNLVPVIETSSLQAIHQQPVVEDIMKNILRVALLTVAEYKEHKDIIPNFKYDWWLRTAGESDVAVTYVNADGFADVEGYNVNATSVAVRPALYLYKVPSLTRGDRINICNCEFIALSKDLLLCVNSIGNAPFRENCFAPHANRYEDSDVKEFLNKWLTQLKDAQRNSTAIVETSLNDSDCMPVDKIFENISKQPHNAIASDDDIIDAVYREVTSGLDSGDREPDVPLILMCSDDMLNLKYITDAKPESIHEGVTAILLIPVFMHGVVNIVNDEGETLEDFLRKNRSEVHDQIATSQLNTMVSALGKFAGVYVFNSDQQPVILTTFAQTEIVLTGSENIICSDAEFNCIPIITDSLVGTELINVDYTGHDKQVYKVPSAYVAKAAELFHPVCINMNTHQFGAVYKDSRRHIWHIIDCLLKCYNSSSEYSYTKARKELVRECAQLAGIIKMEWHPQYAILPVTAILNYLNSLENISKALSDFRFILQNISLILEAMNGNECLITDMQSCLDFLNQHQSELKPQDASCIGVELYVHKFSDSRIDSCIPAIIADPNMAHQMLLELFLTLHKEDDLIEKVISLHNFDIPDSDQAKTVNKLLK